MSFHTGMALAMAADDREERCVSPGERWCRHTPRCAALLAVIGGLSDLMIQQPPTAETARNALMEIVAARQAQKPHDQRGEE